MTKIFGLIGTTLTHSFSKKIFSEKFTLENIDASYELFEISRVADFIKFAENEKNLCGLNVTIPFKETVIEYLDFVDPYAKEIGAVNTIKIVRQHGKIFFHGYNTDAPAFETSLNQFSLNKNKPCLILGTGGASKAVAAALKNYGFTFKFISRSNNNASTFSYKDLNKSMLENCAMVVNTTPLGMYPNADSCPDICYNWLSKDTLCYDLVYNPENTLFMQKAKNAGAKVKNGLEMLQLQAQLAWNIWNEK